jgi:hypothetical protein
MPYLTFAGTALDFAYWLSERFNSDKQLYNSYSTSHDVKAVCNNSISEKIQNNVKFH